MKKLLILLLVLGFASTAHATLSPITSWVDGVCTWTLDLSSAKLIGTGTSATAYTGPWLSFSLGSYTLEATGSPDPWKPGLYQAAGDAGAIGTSGNTYVQASAADNFATVTPDIAVGQWFGMDVAGDTNQDVQIQYYNGTEYETVLQGTIPEPVTLALLGLGGLFLRRRK
jgi:hypothetical protein